VTPVLIYGSAAAAGGATTALGLWILGSLVQAFIRSPGRSGILVVAWLLILAGVVQEARGVISPLPQRKAQVPTRWLGWRRRSATAAAFGFALGAGVYSYLHHAAAYALGGIILLAPSPATACLVGAAYGLGWSTSLIRSWLGWGDSGGYVSWDSTRLHARVLRYTLIGSSLLTALFETVWLLHWTGGN
jgi:hypothetical protein